MASIFESAINSNPSGISLGQIVVRLPPSESLSGSEDGLLRLLVVVAHLSVLAPTGLVFALGAVLASVALLVIHLVHIVKATGSLFLGCLGRGSRLHNLGLAEVVDV